MIGVWPISKLNWCVYTFPCVLRYEVYVYLSQFYRNGLYSEAYNLYNQLLDSIGPVSILSEVAC